MRRAWHRVDEPGLSTGWLRRQPAKPTRRLCLAVAVPAVALLLSFAVACVVSAPVRKQPHDGIAPLWKTFLSLPQQRALALAGDPDGAWVAGAGSGESSQAAAENTALAVCAAKRAARRMQSPCLLYATDDKIVWPVW
jgi:hypothetical protein